MGCITSLQLPFVSTFQKIAQAIRQHAYHFKLLKPAEIEGFKKRPFHVILDYCTCNNHDHDKKS